MFVCQMVYAFSFFKLDSILAVIIYYLSIFDSWPNSLARGQRIVDIAVRDVRSYYVVNE